MTLDALLQSADVWRGDRLNATVKAVPSGFSALDVLLPGGGWPQGALTEIIMHREGIGVLRLLMPALARLSQGDRWICWVAPPYIPYAPALVNVGIDLSRILLVYPRAQQDGLWAVEQSLRSGNCAAVLAWPTLDDEGIWRRLQLAAEAGDALGVLFRPPHSARRPSAAALRIQLTPKIDGSLSVSILKCRGGWAAGPIQLDTSLQTYEALAVHSRAKIAAGNFQSRQR